MEEQTHKHTPAGQWPHAISWRWGGCRGGWEPAARPPGRPPAPPGLPTGAHTRPGDCAPGWRRSRVAARGWGPRRVSPLLRRLPTHSPTASQLFSCYLCSGKARRAPGRAACYLGFQEKPQPRDLRLSPPPPWGLRASGPPCPGRGRWQGLPPLFPSVGTLATTPS